MPAWWTRAKFSFLNIVVEGKVRTLSFLLTGGISGSAEKTAVCFSLNFKERLVTPVRTTELAQEGISDIAIRTDGRLFVTAGWDGRLRIYNRKRATCLAILKVPDSCSPCFRNVQL